MFSSTLDILLKSFIGKVVLVQTLLLFFGIFMTIILLISRNALTDYRKKIQEKLSERLIDFLFSQEKAKIKVWPWQKNIYRDTILNQIHILAGQERDKMVTKYVDCGFLEKDQEQAGSRSWARRLLALIRLDALSLTKTNDVFVRSLNDSHPLVVLSAIRALSRLGKKFEPAQTILFHPNVLLKSLEQVSLERRTALIEVISNIGFHHGAQIICDYLKICEKPEMAMACAHVLGELRDPLAMPIFLQALESPSAHSEAFLIKVLEAIPLIADPDAIQPLRKLLQHKSPQIRARVILALNALGDNEFFQEIEILRTNDSELEVQRALKKIEKRVV